MRFKWDEDKNQHLIFERGVCFEDVVSSILDGKVIATLKNPSRTGQFYFIIKLNGYIHVVPFLINGNEEIILKTIFPSRKFHKEFGGK
jgi:uncharacterized DUF497 family protein